MVSDLVDDGTHRVTPRWFVDALSGVVRRVRVSGISQISPPGRIAVLATSDLREAPPAAVGESGASPGFVLRKTLAAADEDCRRSKPRAAAQGVTVSADKAEAPFSIRPPSPPSASVAFAVTR